MAIVGRDIRARQRMMARPVGKREERPCVVCGKLSPFSRVRDSDGELLYCCEEHKQKVSALARKL
jgi:hypothetical protein